MELQCTSLATCWNIANVCVPNYTLCWRYIYTFSVSSPPFLVSFHLVDVFFLLLFILLIGEAWWRQ